MFANERRPVDWTAAFGAGLTAAVVFVLFELALAGLVGELTWTAPHLILVVLKGGELMARSLDGTSLALEPLLLLLLAAMLIHVALAVAYTALLAWAIRGFGFGASVLAGTVLGILIYVVNFYGVLAFFPELTAARGPVTAVSHLAFGVTAGGTYCVAAAWRRERIRYRPRRA